MIRLEHISRIYGQGEAATRALDDVSLEVPDGAFVVVVGTSGSGKTTLLNILGGLDSGYTGLAQVEGRDLRGLSDRELSRFRNQTVGFVFQHFHLLDHLDALHNVTLPAFFCDQEDAQALARAEEVLVRVGLKDKLRSLPGQLSGGQKQRVAIARALFTRPRLFLCDEPTGNLDTTTGAQIISLFETLNREEGISVLVVTHEDFLFKNATCVVRLEDGRQVGGPGGRAAP
ncbi:MAG TPA: ABC transporter ATP-binding protein [Myxococcota bacterium]|nr:ABC transporter ATP-binding protein [Myxococcota bacterium]HRY94237.1 ABC transporter ATP-binding protein [Myxococcota bacterium]HSA23106.1 ABC transporter ATP-binding protein [Myxococcota bacterium]